MALLPSRLLNFSVYPNRDSGHLGTALIFISVGLSVMSPTPPCQTSQTCQTHSLKRVRHVLSGDGMNVHARDSQPNLADNYFRPPKECCRFATHVPLFIVFPG